MNAFAYTAPASVDELLTTLAEAAASQKRSQILAGGTDLLVQMKTIDPQPRLIVDIKKIPEATQIRINGSQVSIGAAVPSATLNRHTKLCQLLPGLTEAAYLIGSSQIQSRASIGGNLCNASPAGDTIPALIAHDAMCVVRGASGERRIKAADFATGVQKNCLADDECLLALEINLPAGRMGDAYMRFTPRTEMDIAVVGVGVRLTLDEAGCITDARLSIGAMAVTVLHVEAAAAALIGSKGTDDALAAAASVARAAGSPISDKRGSADFRRKIAAVLTKRTVTTAYRRALARSS